MQQSFEDSASGVTSALGTSAPRAHLNLIAAGTVTSFETVGVVNERWLGGLGVGGARL